MSLIPTNATPAVPAQGSFTEGQLDVLKRTIAHGLENDEFELFAAVCRRTGLDPFARQIYPVKRFDKRQGREVMVIQTGIDGYRLIAERSRHYRGQTPTEWCGPDGQWVDVWLSPEPPAAARVGVLRDDFTQPLYAVARFGSYASTNRDGKLMSLWAVMPEVMIAKCAEALAIRKAFPNELSGVYTAEEMVQVDTTNAAMNATAHERPDGIPARDFDEIRAAAEMLTDAQREALRAWCEAEGLVVTRVGLTAATAARLMEKILELGRSGPDGVAGEAPDVEGPSGPGIVPPEAAPSPPVSSDGDSTDAPPVVAVGLSRSGEESTDASGPAPTDDRTQTTHGVALSGPVTLDQLLAAAPGDPGNPGKQRLAVMRTARDVALALSQPVPASLEDLAADPVLAAAVLHDLAGGDAPPPPASPPVGSSRPDDGGLVATLAGGEADGPPGDSPVDHAGKDPHDPAPAGEGVLPGGPDVIPWKELDLTAWGQWNRRCQAKARGTKAKPGVLDPDDEVREEQRHAMAYQASKGRVSSWAAVTQAEGRGIEDALILLAEGRAVLTFGDTGSPGGWIIQRTDVEVPA